MTDVAAHAQPHMPSSPAARRRLAYFLFALAPALWSANQIVARWSADWFPPNQLALYRWMIAAVPMAAIGGAALWAARDAVRREWKDLLVLGAIGMWICGTFVYIGARTTTATNIGLIYAGSPVMMILVSAAFYGERLDTRAGARRRARAARRGGDRHPRRADGADDPVVLGRRSVDPHRGDRLGGVLAAAAASPDGARSVGAACSRSRWAGSWCCCRFRRWRWPPSACRRRRGNRGRRR